MLAQLAFFQFAWLSELKPFNIVNNFVESLSSFLIKSSKSTNNLIFGVGAEKVSAVFSFFFSLNDLFLA